MPGEADDPKSAGTDRLRTRRDAELNTRRTLKAAREVLRKNPQASLAEIAEAAGIGVASVYRRFPTRQDLLHKLIWDLFATDLAPALAGAAGEPDPRDGVRIAFEAALDAASRGGAAPPAVMTLEILHTTFVEPVSRIVAEGQRQGLFRQDLDPAKDTLRIILMLLSVMPTLRLDSDGWRRHLTLVMDSLLLTTASALPPAEAVTDPFLRR